MRVGCEDNHAKSASAHAIRGPWAGSQRGEARAGHEPRKRNAVATKRRSRSRRPGVVSVKKRVGQRRGIERLARLLLRQPRQVRQRLRTLWAVGRFSTGRSARGSHDTRVEHGNHDVSKPQPSTWRGIGDELCRPTPWDGGRRVLAAKTTTPSPPARACSLGHRPVLNGAQRTRVARHGSRTRRQRSFEAAAVDLAWCW